MSVGISLPGKKIQPWSQLRSDSEPESRTKVDEINAAITEKVKSFESERDRRCYVFDSDINPDDVIKVYEELRKNFTPDNGELDVIIESPGGDIDASFNLSTLFRKYASKELSFFVPRWAKSAATLMVCSGNDIHMTDIAELGPLDPQISAFDSLEERYEEFSPLHIDGALDIISSEFEKGHDKTAKGLIDRLQWPLTLGGFKKSLEIGEQYLTKLLGTRMLKDRPTEELAKIAKRLSTGYASHGFCINIDEAKELGLVVKNMNGKSLDICWDIFKLITEKKNIETDMKRKEMQDMVKNLPLNRRGKAKIQ